MATSLQQRRNWDETYFPVERFFGELMTPWWGEAPEELIGRCPLDVREEDGKLMVDAELPGFRREEVQVNIEHGVLTISAEHTEASKPQKGAEHLHERRSMRVLRSFPLPIPVDDSKIEAKLEDGVLHLVMPQTEESKPRRIEVK